MLCSAIAARPKADRRHHHRASVSRHWCHGNADHHPGGCYNQHERSHSDVAPPANVVALVPVSGGGRLFPEATEPTACPSTFDITDIPDWSTLYITIGWDLVEIGGAGEFWGILRGAFVLPGTAP